MYLPDSAFWIDSLKPQIDATTLLCLKPRNLLLRQGQLNVRKNDFQARLLDTKHHGPCLKASGLQKDLEQKRKQFHCN